MNYTSLDILLKCPQAPIPNLGQASGQPQDAGNQQGDPTLESVPPAQSATAGTSVASGAALPPQLPAVQPPAQQSQGQSSAQSQVDDDFADFQAAPTLTSSGRHTLPLPVAMNAYTSGTHLSVMIDKLIIVLLFFGVVSIFW